MRPSSGTFGSIAHLGVCGKLAYLIRVGIKKLQEFAALPPLFFRFVLAYGFYSAAIAKLENIDAVGQWFAELNYPFPYLNAYLAAGTETLGVVLLVLGIATRLICIPLMFVMIIAITTVHYRNGFSCGNNGFEIPLYFFLMLGSLLMSGPGKYSLDALLARRFAK